MNHTKFLRTLMFAAAAVLGTVAARAEDLGAVKSRMEQRIPAVDALKSRGVAGENNRGYLEPRAGATPEDQKIISDDNSDRRAVYTALAQQTGSDADTVGRRRAHQIALSARRGVWIQAPNGEWTQKG